MAEGSKGSEETTSRPQDWEVVSLTASTYAAAPGPKNPEEFQSENKSDVNVNENESPAAMIHSGHFNCPPIDHEAVPIQQDTDENTGGVEISYDVNIEDFPESVKTDEFVGKDDLKNDSRGKDLKDGEEIDANVDNLEISYNDKMESSFQNLHHCTESLQGTELFRENPMQISVVHGKDMDEAKALKGLDWIEPRHQHASVEDDEIAVLAAKFSIFHGDGGGVSSSNTSDDNKAICESQKEVLEQSFSLPKPFSVNEDKQQNYDISSDSPVASKAKKSSGKDLPCEAWWKRHAASMLSQAREANALWPIAIAAALMGLVVLGQQWQQERWQNQQLRSQLSAKDEKISQILHQIARLKEAITGRRKVPIIRSSSTFNSFPDH